MKVSAVRASARTWRRWVLLGILSPLGLVAASCRSPTEIVLKIDTDLECTDPAQWRGVAVYLGKPGAVLEQPTLVTTKCDGNGYVGSVVVAPSGEKDALVGVRVVAGITRNPEDCPDANYDGCIVARRALRYSPHESLELQVSLLRDCISQPCDATHTCVAGRCIDTESVPSPSSPISPDAPSSPTPPSVRCGDDELRCPTVGNVCCLTVDLNQGTARGQCRPSADCPPGNITLLCDDASDCSHLDNGTEGKYGCAVLYRNPSDVNLSWVPYFITGTQCLPMQKFKVDGLTVLMMCQDREPCDDGSQKFPCNRSRGPDDLSRLPGYFWCDYP